VVVKLLGPLIPLAGGSELTISIDESSSILDFFKALPNGLRERLLSEDGLAPDVIVLLNGVAASCLGSLEEITVRDLDLREVVLIPVIHGG